MYVVFFIVSILMHSCWRYTFNLAAAPVINNLPNSTTIHEDTSTAILLYTIDVTDADGDGITCSFGAGTNPGSGQTKFSVQLSSGTTPAVWTINTVAGAGYDSSQAVYSLEIECDANGDTVSNTYTVNISPNVAPVIQNLPDSVNVSTLTASIGYNVFTVFANDTESDQISLSIACAPALPICPFEIFDSGAMQLNADISTTTIPGYDVTVSVSDSSGSGLSKVLTVLFTDINSQPQIQNLGSTINVPENTVLGDTIVTTTCTDSDVTDTLTYFRTCTPSSGSTYFLINSTSGDIYASTTSLINYEYLVSGGSTSFTCTVTCNDGRDTDTATVTFDVIDVNEAPAFTQSAYSISADEGAAGTVIQTTAYDVTDEDSGDTKLFSIDCGTATGYFSINTGTGILSYSTEYDVDDGIRPSSVSCNVTVTDSGGLTDTASLSVTINNINDNLPTFSHSSYTWVLSEGDPIGTTLGTAAATDGDIGTFGDITYGLDQSSYTAEYFEIDQTGVVKIKNSISSLGTGVPPSFYVLATDGGGNETRVIAAVVIAATTTTTTTAAPDRFKTFFDDSRNIAWCTACIVILFVTVILIGWMCFAFIGNQSPPGTYDYNFRCCRLWEEPEARKPRNWGEGHRYNYRGSEPRRGVRRSRRDPTDFRFWSDSYRQLD